MARPINIKQDKEIFLAYQNDPNILGIARALKHHPITIRKSLLRQGVQLGSVEGVANAILKKIEADPTMFSKNFAQLAKVLGSSDVVSVLRNPEKYKEAMITQAKTAALMALTFLISGNKLSEATPSAVAQVLPVLGDFIGGKYDLGVGKTGNLNPENIIEAIQIQLKRIRIFDPKLAKDTEATVQGFINLPGSAVKIIKKTEVT